MSETTSTFLTREQILNANDGVTEIVNIPAWGGKIHIKSLMGKERDAWEQTNYTRKAKGGIRPNLTNSRARLVALTACDENGNLLFTAADVEALGKKNAAALAAAYDVAARLSGITDEELDDEEKN